MGMKVDAATGLSIDADRAVVVGRELVRAAKGEGIFGPVRMPEAEVTRDMERGSLEHIVFMTQTVTIDYQRDATQLWEAAAAARRDPETSWIFDLQALHDRPPRELKAAMAKHKVSRKIERDPQYWRTVGISFLKKWDADPRRLLENFNFDAPSILEYLVREKHTYNQRQTPTFPYLRGKKIGPLWIRMMRDLAGIQTLRNLDKIPVPVDVHILRSSLALGVVRGEYDGPPAPVFNAVRSVWFDASARNGSDDSSQEMLPIDVDTALWTLSRLGCSPGRDLKTGRCSLQHSCPVGTHCIPGRLQIWVDRVDIRTE